MRLDEPPATSVADGKEARQQPLPCLPPTLRRYGVPASRPASGRSRRRAVTPSAPHPSDRSQVCLTGVITGRRTPPREEVTAVRHLPTMMPRLLDDDLHGEHFELAWVMDADDGCR